MAPMNPRLLRPTSGAGAAPCAHPASLLLNFDGSFADSSANSFSVTANGAAISATAKFGSGSGEFDGADDYLVIADSPEFDLSNTPFTIECWFLARSLPNYQGDGISVALVSKDTYGQNFSWNVNIAADGIVFATANASAIYFWPCVVSEYLWHHVAICFRDFYMQVFLDGQSVGEAFVTVTNQGASITVGCNSGNQPSQFFDGYIDGLRITRAALYCGNFTPQASAPTALAKRPCQCPPVPAPPYGTYLRSECQGADFGDVYADGLGGEYFEVTGTDGCL